MKTKNNLNMIIVRHPKVRNNKPRFKNTSITVEFVLKQFKLGWNIDEIKSLVPEVKKTDIKKVLDYFSNDINNFDDEENHKREYSLR